MAPDGPDTRHRGAPAAALIGAACIFGVPAPPAAAEGGAVEVPSGQPVRLQEMLRDKPGEGGVYRFRFVAPRIAGAEAAPDFDALVSDMDALCQSYAVPRISGIEPPPSRIIISLAAEPVAFGASAPDIRQVFEAYSLDGETCVWEMF